MARALSERLWERIRDALGRASSAPTVGPDMPARPRGPHWQTVRVTGAASGGYYPAQTVLLTPAQAIVAGDVCRVFDINNTALAQSRIYLAMCVGVDANGQVVFATCEYCCTS